MATFSRSTTVNWAGSIMEGGGAAEAGTGAFSLPVAFPNRIGDPGGKTSPEELIAASHAGVLRDGRRRRAWPRERIDITHHGQIAR
jgi:hypothetical protein